MANPNDISDRTDVAQAPTPDLLRRLWTDHIRKYWPIILISVALMTVQGGAIGAFAWLVQPLFDELFSAGSMEGVTWVAMWVGILFTLRATSGFLQRILIVGVGLRVVADLQSRMVDHLLSLDMGFFQDNPPGALIERVRGDTSALQSLSSSVLVSLGRDSIALVSLLVVMLWTDWSWTLTALIGLPLLVLPLLVVQRFIRRTAVRARVAAARLSTRLDEIFHGVQTIKLNRLEGSENARFRDEISNYLRPSYHAQIGVASNPAMVDIIAAAGFVSVLYFGGQDIIEGEKSVGEFMSFFTALGLLFEPLRKLANIAGQLQTASASLERVYAVFETRPTILSPGTPKPLQPGDITFDGVNFAYGDTPILRDLSFTAKAGETTALVGASGAGKTTVFGVLTRLIDPSHGTITIGDMPVDAVALTDLRDTIAVVGQDTALFDESIAANILMGDMDAGPEALGRAAHDASVDVFADKMPDGLDTAVGPRGSGLSGGQRQRVAIARAMLKSAPVLLLDEPTSALDAESEKLVGAALDRLAQGRTTLVIAHRLSTIRAAHKIVVLEAGHVIEQGTHDELLEKGGAYARLYKLQISGAA